MISPTVGRFRKTRARLVLAGTLSALWWCGACGSAPAPSSPQPPEPEVEHPVALAEVNGAPVLQADFDLFVEFLGEEAGGESRDALFARFIESRVLEQAALKEGVQVTEAEVQNLLVESMEDEAHPAPQVVEQLRRYLRVQKFLRGRIDAAADIQIGELQEYYERHAEEFVVDDQLTVLEILVRDRETAERLRADLRRGDFRSFREAARRHSTGATAARGGEMGPFQRGDLPKKFEDFIFGLKVGEVSSVFRSELGYHIFVVEELTPRHAQKFHEVQPRIFAQLVAERERTELDSFLRKQMESASIRILDDRLKNSWREPNAQPEP